MTDATFAAPIDPLGGTTRTWWGARWLGIVSKDTARYAKDVLQGDALFRRGAVSDLTVNAGVARARITDRNTTVTVSLAVDVLDHTMWERVAAVVAEQLRFTAALLHRQFPEALDTRLNAVEVALFPTLDDITFDSEMYGSGVNRHTVALHRAIGSRIDRDPNMLFVLRGREMQQVINAVNTKRGDTAAASELPEVSIAEQTDALRQLSVHPRRVEDPTWLLGRLDEPPAVVAREWVSEAVTRAATTAWRIAAGDGGVVADTELLLAELRARRVGTPAVLAEAIGHDPAQVQAILDELFDAGVVLRTGTPPNVKYRVAAR